MKEAFEKIKESFANIHRVVKTDEDLEWNRAVWRCTEIVQEVAKEYGNGWIPCSERLPSKEECGNFARAWFQVTIPQHNCNKTTVMQYTILHRPILC